MHLTRITSSRRHGFRSRPLHKKRKSRLKGFFSLGYLKQKYSFFVASISLFAFVAGNMLGQYGWHTFRAALGNADDSLVVYTGTVTPIDKVPDYVRWAQYGGHPALHTFRQVPKDLLVPLPPYDSAEQRQHESKPGDVYSTGHMGDYDSGAEGEGSHVGVDIRAPIGTPVRSIAAGIVTDVREDKYGFGKLIVIRHPHMPDPANPKNEIVLHSNYAHLSAQLVSIGQLVQKGEEIGLTGMTGFATGPHLHFQIDRDTAPFHPFWPFSASEARNAGFGYTQALNDGFQQQRGYEFTLNPMLVVQANLPAVEPGKTRAVAVKTPSSKPRVADAATLRQQRMEKRLARAAAASSAQASVYVAGPIPAPVASAAASLEAVSSSASSPAAAPAPAAGAVSTVDIQHHRSFAGREWETVEITLLDADGRSVDGAALAQPLYLKTAYGDAQFDPPILRPEHFDGGTATVKMLPMGRRTVHVLVQPLGVVGPAMEYKGS
jgi:murein DD-endopeptidase MepM/ murein hydrolase activator NlpD